LKIAIASGKGGTGKTTLATNLAAYIAEHKPVVLADLDVEEPNSGLFIQGEVYSREDQYKQVPVWDAEKCIHCGKCQEVCNFNAIIALPKTVMIFDKLCHSCYACAGLCPAKALDMQPQKIGVLKASRTEKLTFVESRLDIGQEMAVPLIARSKEWLDAHFPDALQLLDSPPGTSCPVIEATKDVDFVILVTEPTPFGLHDLTLAVETMRELGKPHAVVINRAQPGATLVDDYCTAEGIPVLAHIDDSRQVAECYSRGELIYPTVPQMEESLKAIVAHIKSLGGAA
jgi:MinD superfamily P-loop ATPase